MELAVEQGDAKLIESAVGGDANALRALLERYGPQVWNEINTKIGPVWRSAIDADDVMQVTYVEAFLHISTLQSRDAASFLPWLRRSAENNLRDAVRELERKKRPSPARRVQQGVTDDSYVALVEMLGHTTTTPSRLAAAGEVAERVRSLLDRLPPAYREVVRLYDLEGFDIAEVARALGRSGGAVHMLRARAHDRLRALLGAEAGFFSSAP